MRLASTTSNGASPAREAAGLARARRRPSRLRRALAIVASMAIGSVSTPRAVRGAEPERGDRQDPRAAADVEHAGAGEHAPIGERLDPGQAQPGRRVEAGPEGHPGVEREHDVVRLRAGGVARSAGSPAAGRRAGPGSAPSRPPPSPPRGPSRVRSSPIGRSPNAWRWPSAASTSATAASAAARSRAGHVGADDRRPRRVDPGAEALVDELERRARRSVPPGATRPRISLTASTASGSASTASSSQAPAAESAAARRGRPRVRQPQPELLEDAAAARSTRLARLLGVRLEQLALLLRQLARAPSTSTRTWRSPREPARRRWGTPLPRSRISVSGWVPALISTSSSPSTVGTVMRRAERGLGDRDRRLVEELGARRA